MTPFDDDKAKTIKTMNMLREKWNLAHMQDLRRGKGEKAEALFKGEAKKRKKKNKNWESQNMQGIRDFFSFPFSLSPRSIFY